MMEIKYILHSIALALILIFITNCSPKPYSLSTDNNLCPEPPPEVFAGAKIDVDIAKSAFEKLTIGGGSIKVEPKVLSIVSKAAHEEQVWSYLLCLEDLRKGYNKNQVAWHHSLRTFMQTDPSSADYIRWAEKYPFPHEGNNTASGIGNNKIESKDLDEVSEYSQIYNWKQEIWGSGNSIGLINFENQTIVKIESSFGRNAAWIESRKIEGPGKFRFEAKVKGVDLVQKGHEYFERGKFQVVIVENGRDIEWPADDDFLSTDGWVNKSVEIELQQGEKAVFRVGLQRTKGTVLVKDIEVYKIGVN